jgi:hypothetical protein
MAFIACKNQGTPTIHAKIVASPHFLIQTTIDSMDMPSSKVSFQYDTVVEVIDTTSGALVLLTDDEKQEFKMPSSYIVAGKAFWAGLQTILVIDSTANGYIIKRQYTDESTTANEPYETIKSFPK